jgi:hypothetical protein
MRRVLWKRLSRQTLGLGVRILFDQGVPAPLRRHIDDHSIETAAELGWATLTDRELLDRAEAKALQAMSYRFLW